MPDESVGRSYDGNGNLVARDTFLPTFYEHDYRDRITRVSPIPILDSATGVPSGNERSDGFATGIGVAWSHNPAAVGQVTSGLWGWNAGGYLEPGAQTISSASVARTNPDGDFWWVNTRPSGATGNDVMDAYLRITDFNTDTELNAVFLRLEVNTDTLRLVGSGGTGLLETCAITTTVDTPYLLHAHVVGSQVVVRRAQLGQPLVTVLETDSAPLQDTDRFILETTGDCYVDDVNIGHFTTEYAYDALGRRIEKRHADGTATRYVYDGSRVAEEWAVSSGGGANLSASYVYGNYIDEVLTMRRGTSDYYYHGDDQHNVVKLTDNTGTVVESYDYGDYGQPEFYDASGALLDVSESPFGNPYLFTGRRWDEELGYYYFRNRYMDPALGRFVSRDPIGLWGDAANLGNGYTYAASNPWSMVDPFGLCGGNVGKPIADVLSDFGYSWPAPNASAYNPEIEARLQQAFHDTLNDQVVWVANGVAFLPGPTGVAGDGVAAVLTGNYWTLVPISGGHVLGGLRKVDDVWLATELRKMSGKARGAERLKDVSGKWLKGSHGNAGRVPGQVARQLEGRKFRDFDHFREEFWKTVASDKGLASQFKDSNVSRMRKGLAPRVAKGQRIGKARSYVLHHNTPIHAGGAVYDLDNITVATPRFHKEILAPDYHYGN